jgi:short-subunit dehydrogenase
MSLRNKGGIVFLSSIVAFSAIKGWAGYAASKSYNLLLSETLAYELSSYNIDVVTLCPGATTTEFLKKAGLREDIGIDLAKVVNEALNALGVKNIVIPGFINRYNIFWSNILPRKFNAWFSSFMLNKVKIEKD